MEPVKQPKTRTKQTDENILFTVTQKKPNTRSKGQRQLIEGAIT
jgi:hypothetical protein